MTQTLVIVDETEEVVLPPDPSAEVIAVAEQGPAGVGGGGSSNTDQELITHGAGLVLNSPDGSHRCKLSISNTGEFLIEEVGSGATVSDFELTTPGTGYILNSPDGTERRKLWVDNTGNLIVEDV